MTVASNTQSGYLADAEQALPSQRPVTPIVLVTGGGRGIGRAECLSLAATGAHVVVADRESADETVAEIHAAGGSGVAYKVDLRDWGGCERLVDWAFGAHGDLHAVVNNAGALRDRMCFNLTEDDWSEALDINLKGTFAICRMAAFHWRRRYHAGDRQARNIVNTISESGLYGSAGQSNYAAAKAGIAALTVTLAEELASYGVRVNAIAPRARTAMSETALGSLPRQSTGEDPFDPGLVAAVVTWLASNDAAGISGQVIGVSGLGIEVFEGWRVKHRVPYPSRGDINRVLRDAFADYSQEPPGPIADLFRLTELEPTERFS